MGFFSRLFGNESTKNKEESSKNASSKNIIDTMLMTAEVAINKKDYAMAAKTYKDILKLESNATAQCNLGSLYAQGKGVKQDFKEAAYWFRQAELSGDEQAERLCLKCSMDFIHQNFDIIAIFKNKNKKDTKLSFYEIINSGDENVE